MQRSLKDFFAKNKKVLKILRVLTVAVLKIGQLKNKEPIELGDL
jgi:hypothetical protein